MHAYVMACHPGGSRWKQMRLLVEAAMSSKLYLMSDPMTE